MENKQERRFSVVRLVVIAALTVFLFGGGLFVYQYFTVGIACTQEAIRCPDGSIVGRTGPFCVARCPGKSEEPSLKIQETDTSTWKTYRNEQYGFEVRYPSQFIVVERELSNAVYFNSDPAMSSYVQLVIDKNPASLSLERYVEGLVARFEGIEEVLKRESIIIHETPAIEIYRVGYRKIKNGEITEVSDPAEFRYVFFRDGTVYILRGDPRYPINKQHQQLVSTIASTFKFK